MGTYRLWNDESREKVPPSIEGRWNYSGYIMIWCYSHSHHPVECEVQQGEIHEEKVPTELCNRPIESNHCIHYDTIYKCLNEKVREFDDNLQKRKGFCENIMMSSYTRVSIIYVRLPVRRHMAKQNTFLLLFLYRRLFSQ